MSLISFGNPSPETKKKHNQTVNPSGGSGRILNQRHLAVAGLPLSSCGPTDEHKSIRITQIGGNSQVAIVPRTCRLHNAMFAFPWRSCLCRQSTISSALVFQMYQTESSCRFTMFFEQSTALDSSLFVAGIWFLGLAALEFLTGGLHAVFSRNSKLHDWNTSLYLVVCRAPMFALVRCRALGDMGCRLLPTWYRVLYCLRAYWYCGPSVGCRTVYSLVLSLVQSGTCFPASNDHITNRVYRSGKSRALSWRVTRTTR